MRAPIYITIHNKLREDIENGRWKVGDKIPAERDLALEFHVSRMTLRQAVQTLVDEGVLKRHVGSGTFVASEKVQEKMSGITSFTDLMQAQGKVPSSKTVTYHLTTPTLSEIERLQLPKGNQVLRMERVRYADGVPICFETTAVPADLIEGFSKEEITASLYHALESKGGYQLGGAQQVVSATLASERIADFLKIKRNDAILKLRQISFFKSGRPFEYVRTEYVGSRFEFYLER